MDLAEENSTLHSGRFLFLWLLVLMMVGFSCQQDEEWFEPEVDTGQQNVLKNIEILSPGEFKGTYSGGEWTIKLPEDWNSSTTPYLIFYAHGMVDPVPYEPVQLPNDFIGGQSVADIVTGMNMGYVATSYRDNGLIVLEAVEDVKNLVDVVNQFFFDHTEYSPPVYLFLGGPSEGGQVTVKTIEKYPYLFDGAISICGPIGNYYNQLQYNGDFHVLFNYFFGADLAALGINLGSPLGVNPALMAAWKANLIQPAILAVLSSNPGKVLELLRCAKVPVDVTDDDAVGTAILELLRFNIMLTNNVIEHMNGVPYNNKFKWYSGSSNDRLLNRTVERILDKTYHRAKNTVRKYETSGEIAVPLVTIHTTGDHVVPFWHNPLYRLKVFVSGSSLLHTGIPVVEYGHCTIDETHVMAAVAIIITKATLMDKFEIASTAFKSDHQRQAFKKILKENAVDVEFD
ncbi:hypothetical protein [Gaoshiqia sediminis]|uniref:Uncharacterized protein n=1 Tax=Gaoshiqia sediminis TaxID=2986998 RepID=A0AA42C9W6_9BACT|nr:hypothetical protein [Gaoshiqia sediminis]MCW0484576.1 hypothetical protein [Gaoshiqia sediminis]